MNFVAENFECDLVTEPDYSLCYRKDTWEFEDRSEYMMRKCQPCEHEIGFVAERFDCIDGDYTQCVRKEGGSSIEDRSLDLVWKCGYLPEY